MTRTTRLDRIVTLPRSLAQLFADRYLAVDPRTLGLFRIVFGLLLIVNLHDRTQGPDGIAFYTNDGTFPNHYALFAPMGPRIWSLLFPFSTPTEVQVAFGCILLVYVAYVVGYRTKLAQILTVLCVVSLDNRNLIMQNGGIVVTNLITVWTAFLPLGARFSLDRVLARRARVWPFELPGGRLLRVAYFGIVLNFAAIYLFNCLHKIGVTWHDGSAVHWVLWQNRIATIFAAWLRMHEPRWLSPAATRGTLILEGALPLLLLCPIFQKWTRRAAIAGIALLHGGIALAMTLGPFSYSMMAFSVLLLGPWDWALVSGWAERRGITALRSEETASSSAPPMIRQKALLFASAGEIMATLLLVCVVVQLGMDNWIIAAPYRVKNRPEIMGAVVDYLRIPQGWGMFAPEAPRDDGTIVVDAVLEDGSHIDPLNGKVPDFEPARHGPWFQDQQWCDYFLRMRASENAHFYPYFRDYIASLDRYRGWAGSAPIRAFDVYWINNAAPPPGSTEPTDFKKTLLFSGGGHRKP